MIVNEDGRTIPNSADCNLFQMIKSAVTPNKRHVKIQAHMAPLLLKLRNLDVVVLMTRIHGDKSEGMVVHSNDSTWRIGYTSTTWNVESGGDWEPYEGVVTLKNELPGS